MKITIKPKTGYTVRRILRGDLSQKAILLDGDKPIMVAMIRSYKDFHEECTLSGNDCANLCEVFKTIKGNMFVYWRDEETDEDFLTKLPK